MIGPGEVRWEHVTDKPSWRKAIVSTVSPLRLAFHGQTLTNVEPLSLVENLRVGQEVYCQFVGRGSAKELVIIGVLGGAESSWVPYVPALRGTVANPTGWTSKGRYRQEGDLVHVEAQINFPSSWNRGEGHYQVTLPVTPVGYSDTHRTNLPGEVAFGGDAYLAHGLIEDGSGLASRVYYTNGGVKMGVSAAVPSSFGSGRIVLSGAYQSARQ